MKSVTLKYETFVSLLIEEVPELFSVYEEHLDDNDGLLEHVFMGDVTRFIVIISTEEEKSEVLDRIITLLDKAIRSKDEKLQELISVSFLENLPQHDSCYTDIKKVLPPALLKELAHYQYTDD